MQYLAISPHTIKKRYWPGRAPGFLCPAIPNWYNENKNKTVVPLEILYTPLDRLDTVWPHALPHVEAGLANSRGEYLPEDILADLHRSRMQLWCILDDHTMPGAIVTQIIDYPRRRCLRLVACGGERMNEWLELAHDEIEDWARRAEVDMVETYGRQGWLRVFRRFGFEPTYATATKEL